MALNKVLLIGGVGADPEIRDANGTKVASLRVATSEKYTDRNGEKHEQTEWHSVVAWRNTAELIEKYVHKGDTIFVEGKLRTRKYTTQNGDRYVTEVVVDNLQFFPKKNSENESPAYQALTAPDDMPDF